MYVEAAVAQVCRDWVLLVTSGPFIYNRRTEQRADTNFRPHHVNFGELELIFFRSHRLYWPETPDNLRCATIILLMNPEICWPASVI